jgi:hypothetical protein
LPPQLARGLSVIRDLDAAVVIGARHDPIRLAAWHAARRIEGQGSSSSALVKVPVTVDVASSPGSSSIEPPEPDTASPPAAEASPASVAPVLVVDGRLEKAS